MSETSELPSTRTWDGAASAPASHRAQQFETAWKAATSAKSRPEPRAFLPEAPRERPAVLLALLRTEMGLRYEANEKVRVEEYRDRYPELDADSLVALVYEDFCLREESGDAPVPQEYDERFPELVDRLKRVFDIHDLVGGSTPSMALLSSSTSEVPFPEVGQTIAGFHLREKLGQGSFARVFVAEERQLADRPVAIKVSRTGSREPQTLARLQHTHIVPVHSYRIDPATDLHLLCMPFFGRITLERLLAEPALRTACTGGDILGVLDRLDSAHAKLAHSSRTTLAELPFARAVSWWGARMAEALAHAHDRGVMHRDIKPSNVLITSDGLPMLLDFNLAREPWDPESTAEPEGMFGGTLAYMAPEHIDAISEGRDENVDGRADEYSLGVLLFEALTGRRPFAATKGASVRETLRRAAEARRASVPSIRATHPEMPVALEAVILRCLDPDPNKRHPDAASLAADLQAVADERPLPYTREPLSSRARRWVSRHRFGLTLTVPLLILASMLVNLARQAREDQSRLCRQIDQWVADGAALEADNQPLAALAKYQDAAQLASEQPLYQLQPPLLEGFRKATDSRLRLKIAAETTANAQRFLSDIDELNERLLQASTPQKVAAVAAELDQRIGVYAPLANRRDWTESSSFGGLARPLGDRLESAFERMLIERIALAGRGAPLSREAMNVLLSQGALISDQPEQWSALRAWVIDGRKESLQTTIAAPEAMRNAALILALRGDMADAIKALRSVTATEPGDYATHRRLAALLAGSDRSAEALAELEIAVALRPDAPEARRERNRLRLVVGLPDPSQPVAGAPATSSTR